MVKLRWMTLLVMMALAIGLVGCSDDDDDDDGNPTGPSGDDTSYTTYQIDAKDYDSYVYYDLSNDQEVTVDDPQSNTVWTLGFMRYNLKLNSGDSGPNSCQAVDLEEMQHEYGTDFDAVTSDIVIPDEEWQEDSQRFVFDGWYSYDPVEHVVSPTTRVFALRDAAGDGYAKLMVTDVSAAGMGQIGSVEITFVYDAGGTDLSDTSIVVTMEDSDGDNSIFFSLAEGGSVDIADPATSSDWDLWFDGFDAKINGGISGPGACGVYPTYDDPDFNDYDAITTAPPDMGGSYEQDSALSVFDNWYDYNGQTHELISKAHVYLIQIDASTIYKFQIQNYYKVVVGSPVAGWITFRYEQL